MIDETIELNALVEQQLRDAAADLRAQGATREAIADELRCLRPIFAAHVAETARAGATLH